jgi:hypothetical protein
MILGISTGHAIKGRAQELFFAGVMIGFKAGIVLFPAGLVLILLGLQFPGN